MGSIEGRTDGKTRSKQGSIQVQTQYVENTIQDHLLPISDSTPLFRRTPSLKSHQSDIPLGSIWLHLRKYGWQEARELYRLTFPIALSFLLQQSISTVNVFSMGHIGAAELAASTLATLYFAITCFSIAQGLNTAMDTLGPQTATGSNNPKSLGIVLQRAILINTVVLIPMGALGEYIMLGLKQDPEISRLASLFVKMLIPGLPAYVYYDCLRRFLAAQGNMHAATYVMGVGVIINGLLNYCLVWYEPLRIGFIGSPIANVITYWCMFLLLLLYVSRVEGYQMWGGWSREALKGWRTFLRLGLPGIAMVCSEWWAFEVCGVAAGWFGSTSLGAQSIILTVAAFFFMLPYGMSMACSVRIGRLIGSGRGYQARLACAVVLICAACQSSINISILLIARDYIGYIFTSDSDVVKLVSITIPIAAAFQLGESCSTTGGGIFRGLGRQHQGASVNFIGFYIVGLPIGLALALLAHLELQGLWWGLCISIWTAALSTIFLVTRIHWDEEVQKSQRLVSDLTNIQRYVDVEVVESP